jgi:hypothetical protein
MEGRVNDRASERQARDRKKLAWLLCSLAILLKGFAGHSSVCLVRTISVQASAANESGHNWRNRGFVMGF